MTDRFVVIEAVIEDSGYTTLVDIPNDGMFVLDVYADEEEIIALKQIAYVLNKDPDRWDEALNVVTQETTEGPALNESEKSASGT